LNGFTTPQSHVIYREHPCKGIFSRPQLRLSLILFLALTFFLFCPLWAYLSLCGMSMHHDARPDCFLYSFIFNMPMSVPPPAILLVVLTSFGVLAAWWQSPVFQTSIYPVLARAPPLS
jgi:hypothetical protein